MLAEARSREHTALQRLSRAVMRDRSSDDFASVSARETRSSRALKSAKSACYGRRMSPLCSLSDSELVSRLPALVQAERHAMIDVIEHLVEMERRRLYLRHAVSSLYRYCIERLGYAQDAALKRHRVAKLALRLPQVLDELRARTMHLTGVFLLSKHLTEDNATVLLGQARGKSRRQIEELIALWFPRPDVSSSLVTCSRAGEPARARLEPLSSTRLRVEFTARVELHQKIEKALELLSHAVPSGDLGELFERAVDALIEQRRASASGQANDARQSSSGRVRVMYPLRSRARFGSEIKRNAPPSTAKVSAAQSDGF
jgi:hypothetical protein